MSDKKSKGGRPRKYPKEDKYARQRAYYERKKKKLEELEEKVKQFQQGKELSSDQKKILTELKLPYDTSFSWNRVTPSEIALMGTSELKQIVTILKEEETIDSLLKYQIFNLIVKTVNVDYLDSSKNISSKNFFEILREDIERILLTAQESSQKQTLIYLLEAELDSRTRAIKRENIIDVFESKVTEFVQESEEKEFEAKIKEKTSK